MRLLLLVAGSTILAGCVHLPWHRKQIRTAQSQLLDRPTSSRAWMDLAEAYRKAGDKQEAIKAYGQALRLDPQNTAARLALQELGPDRSVKRLQRKALRNPTDDELWGDLGDEFRRQGMDERALAAYRYALSLDPVDSEWHTSLLELGGGEAVLEILHERVQRYPEDDEALGDYADALMALGRREEACLAYERARQIDPQDSEWLDRVSACGVEAMMTGGDSGVPSDMLQAGGLETGIPGSADGDDEYVGAQAHQLLEAGRVDEAIEGYRRALEMDPTDPEWLSRLVFLTEESKVDILRSLTDRHGENDELWGNLGDHLVELGLHEEALEAYGRAAELDPQDEEWPRKVQWLNGP